MTGIYIIKNKINDKVYIGQAVDIMKRWYAHRSIGDGNSNPKHPEYNNKIHSAMRNFGKDNFYIEVLEECNIKELSDKEKFWIENYNSFYYGYNSTKGGSWKDVSHVGEENGKAKMTENDIRYIREEYNKHTPFREVYELFKDKITKRGLQKIWYFETWSYILPEYNTKENKEWHRTKSKSIKAYNRTFNEEQVKQIRELYKQGYSCFQIIKELNLKVSKSCVERIVNYTYYKDIV